MLEERFIRELERMQEFEHAFLICEFSYSDMLSFPRNTKIPARYKKYMKVKGPWMAKWMTDITVEYNIPVFYGESTKIANHICYRIMKNVYDLYEVE